jgi:transposase
VSSEITCFCDLFAGFSDVTLLDLRSKGDGSLVMRIETRPSIVGCPTCGSIAQSKGRSPVELIDLDCFGRATRTIWVKRRYVCVDSDCDQGTWTEVDDEIAPVRTSMTTRAGRWVTQQVGRSARSVSEVATELGCDWHTVNDTVVAYGRALIDGDPDRFGVVHALGLDEVLFARLGTFHERHFSTSIVDVTHGQLLDIVKGRSGKEPTAWLDRQGGAWRDQVRFATCDLSGPYRAVFEAMLPAATLVADPFHVVKLANAKLDECRRRVQNETLGHRGRKDDPLYRCRRLLTKADERLDDKGRTKLLGLLEAGDPRGEVRMAWHAKETVRSIYDHDNAKLAVQFVDRMGHDLQDESCPEEVRSLGRTLLRWRDQIAAWHAAHVSNGPTEAANNLIKRVKRAAFGFTSFRNYRIRALLYAGKPNWSLLATLTPR